MTPSRAFFTIGLFVKIFMPGIVGIAHDATYRPPARDESESLEACEADVQRGSMQCCGGPRTGLGDFSISTRHIRQLPATERRSWKQKRGTLMPVDSMACRMLEPLSICTGLPSTTTSM